MLKLSLNYLKSFGAECIIFILTVLICGELCLLKDVSQEIIQYISFIPLAISSFVSAFICARLNGKNGLLHGLFSQLPFLALLIVVSFIIGKAAGVYALIPVTTGLLFGAAGGILAVNTKRK